MFAMTADRHNFGQQVEPTERASSFYFKKPRTVFWEWLFFGQSSPLRSCFDIRGVNSGLTIAEAIFNLDVSCESEWSGLSQRVSASDAIVDGEEKLRVYSRFGMLLAYSYVFGIRDLHHANLVRCATHLQVIDAEIVFVDLILPHETLLLPFKDVPWSQCGLSLMAKTKDAVGPSEAQAMMAGYLDVMTMFHEHREKILSVFSSLDLSHPVRVILRNTAEYSDIIKGGAGGEPLLESGRAQLTRGDIPYFFKRLGERDIFWLSDAGNLHSREFSTVGDHGSFANDIARHAVLPARLLASAGAVETRMLRGVLYLQKLFGTKGDFIWRQKPLVLASMSVHVEALGQIFKSS